MDEVRERAAVGADDDARGGEDARAALRRLVAEELEGQARPLRDARERRDDGALVGDCALA